MSNKNLINGEYDWAKSFGSSGSDIGADITISNDGSIFISGWTVGNLNNQIHAGVSNNSDGINDAYVMKLDSNGNEQWTKLFGTTEEDNSYAVHISNDGFIYITGETSGNLNNQINSGEADIFITKLNSKS